MPLDHIHTLLCMLCCLSGCDHLQVCCCCADHKLPLWCSWNEEGAELEKEAAAKAERTAFEELTPQANLLQSQNAVGQLASEPLCF